MQYYDDHTFDKAHSFRHLDFKTGFLEPRLWQSRSVDGQERRLRRALSGWVGACWPSLGMCAPVLSRPMSSSGEKVDQRIG